MKNSLFLLLYLCLGAWGQVREPVPPKEPIVPGVSNKTPRAARSDTPVGIPLKARIIFASGATNHGTIYLPREKITFRYSTNELEYDLSLGVSNLAALSLRKWRGKMVKDKVYEFRAVKNLIYTKDGRQLSCNYNIPEFNSFIIVNKYGKARIHTYYRDKWDRKRWFNSSSSVQKYPETHPHPKTAVLIIFD